MPHYQAAFIAGESYQPRTQLLINSSSSSKSLSCRDSGYSLEQVLTVMRLACTTGFSHRSSWLPTLRSLLMNATHRKNGSPSMRAQMIQVNKAPPAVHCKSRKFMLLQESQL